MDEFSASDDDNDDDNEEEDDEDEDEDVGNLGDSYLSRIDDDDAVESIFSGSGVYEDEQHMMGSMMEEYDEDADEEDADDENVDEEDADEEFDEEGDDDGEEEVEEETGGLNIPEVPKAQAPSPKIAVHDELAEIITGVQQLEQEKEVPVQE
ncbi:LNS2-domain-containing protein [Apiospora kogelbergensis]|uniref:LNS2-domain-containing protein n=1 Tax=Apiospora kogelbergensis TaxID=1337665 RepID=A0AAW0RCG0_9PEZI